MIVWIQYHDYSSISLESPDINSALEAYDATDWESELQKEQEAIDSGTKSCPPGMGFVDEDKIILHICPTFNDFLYHYHHPVRKKLFGFIPYTNQEVYSVYLATDEHRLSIITYHYHGQHDKILELLQKYGTQ